MYNLAKIYWSGPVANDFTLYWNRLTRRKKETERGPFKKQGRGASATWQEAGRGAGRHRGDGGGLEEESVKRKGKGRTGKGVVRALSRERVGV